MFQWKSLAGFAAGSVLMAAALVAPAQISVQASGLRQCADMGISTTLPATAALKTGRRGGSE